MLGNARVTLIALPLPNNSLSLIEGILDKNVRYFACQRMD